MPSTNKTSFLNLNKWVASDAPKMSDFNSDNQLVDDAVKSHFEDGELHLSAADRQWLDAPAAAGSYTGDGAETRTIDIGFEPRLLMIFARGYGPLEGDSTGTIFILRHAIACGGAATLGLSTSGSSFTVSQFQYDPPVGMAKVSLNETGVTYTYFAIK